jgi:hypothetical protein
MTLSPRDRRRGRGEFLASAPNTIMFIEGPDVHDRVPAAGGGGVPGRALGAGRAGGITAVLAFAGMLRMHREAGVVRPTAAPS